MFTKLAKNMNKVISYPSRLLSASAMVAMVFVVLAVSVDVFMRYVFNSPIYGVWDLCTIAFVIIIWGPMAMTAIKGSHIALTFILDRFPRLPRLLLELIISLVTSGMLGLVSWRILIYAIDMGATQVNTPSLRIPYEPFGYFVAFACAIMALAFLAGFPETVGKIRREQQ